jgi:hypothetical protein
MAIDPSGGAAAPNDPSATLADAPVAPERDVELAPAESAPTERTSLRLTVANALAKISPNPDDAVRAAEPVSPHVYADTRALPVRSQAATNLAYVRLALAAASGLAGSVLLVATSPVWRLAPADTWRVSLLDHPVDGSFYAGLTFVVGILLMSLGWLGLIGHMRRRVGSDRSRLKWLLVVTVLWSLPLLLSPIQLSTDAYSYAAQGNMASLGIDPSAHGPNALPNHGNNPFWRAADPIWRDAPAPYGPVSVGLAKATVTITGFDVSHAVWGFRFLATAGVVMAGVGVFLIARTRRVSAPMALALAIANPLVLVHLIGGAHNDALMMGLLVLGVAAFERGRKILAVVLVTLAVTVKLPAILALAFFAYQWKGRDAEWRERLIGFPIVGAMAGGIIAALCLVAGIGLGWITALSGTGKVYSTFAVFTKLGFLTSDLLSAAGIRVDPLTVVAGARYVGLLVAAAAIAALVVKSPKLGVAKSVGLALLVLILCGPVVWPWYLPAGFALLAAAGIGRYRPTLIVLVVSASLLVWPTSVNAVDGLSRYQHWLGFLVVLIIAAACVGAQYAARLAAGFQRRRGVTDLYEADDTDERVLEQAERPSSPALAGTTAD